MRITFVLPGFITVPMGGVKVVHEYANRLAERGHQVTLIYPLRLQTNLLYRLKKSLIRSYDRVTGNRPELYYTPIPEVVVLTVNKICDKYLPDADAVIAVGWQTAEPVCHLAAEKGRKFYLLQSFETYFKNRQAVLKTYHLPLKKIAISGWIIDEFQALNETAYGPLGNAVNANEFYLEQEYIERSTDLAVVYHPAKIKGAGDTLYILKELKKKFPKLTAILISSRRPYHCIPAWVDVHIRPDIDTLRKLYNSTKIFLHTSYWEGWGLPVMEAMACGCAIVAYRNKGLMEFIRHPQNGLLTNPGDRKKMIEIIKNLLDKPLNIHPLVKEAISTISLYSWDDCVDNFESFLTN
ncbi:MAG TPA: glycosyltransferase [Candidatus Marinimicrobia bacterium]|nr:glycosyltransferase [Candidatus Neomarinimicrobiota bacterium]